MLIIRKVEINGRHNLILFHLKCLKIKKNNRSDTKIQSKTIICSRKSVFIPYEISIHFVNPIMIIMIRRKTVFDQNLVKAMTFTK